MVESSYAEYPRTVPAALVHVRLWYVTGPCSLSQVDSSSGPAAAVQVSGAGAQATALMPISAAASARLKLLPS